MPRKKQPYDFESSLTALQKLVETMEQGDLSLEDSLAAFEQGIKLTRECQTMLSKAEQKVQLLISKNSGIETQPLE